MYPGFFAHWKSLREEAHEHVHPGCGGGWRGKHKKKGGYWAGGHRGFGARRPLRFMAHKLDLDDEQVKTLARILNDLKTERSQGEVDHQRAVGLMADALEKASFATQEVQDALKLRIDSAERLEGAVLKALQTTHEMLDAEQRTKLAYLLRSGALTI